MSATIYSNSSFTDTPYGLKLQQTFTTSGSVTIPTGINRVYAICIAGGGGGAAVVTGSNSGGGAGSYSAGWTWISNTVTVGTGGTGGVALVTGAVGNPGRDSIYGMVFARGGNGASLTQGGGAGNGTVTGNTSAVSYTGAPVNTYNGNGGSNTVGAPGVCGGGGSQQAGGSGLVGGGGGGSAAGGAGNGGAGGTGFTTAGQIAGGGGAGYISAGGNASSSTGGTGGNGGGGGGGAFNATAATGGTGGDGVVYLYY
jgi:hypothetical protein